jgi:hypothetical protein
MRGSSSGLQFCSVVWDEMSGNRSADAVCFNHCKRCWAEGGMLFCFCPLPMMSQSICLLRLYNIASYSVF